MGRPYGRGALAATPSRDYVGSVRVDILSKEYPPQIYGGAGVHVSELVRALRSRGDIDVQVRCFGPPRDEHGTFGYSDLSELGGANPAIRTLGVDLAMASDCVGADLVHSHTWYANMGGHLASLLAGVPHVVTAHSSEAGMPCPPSPSGSPTSRPRRWSRSARACGRTCSRATRRSTRPGCTWCTTASTPSCGSRTPPT